MRSVRRQHGALSLDTAQARAVFDGESLSDLAPDEGNRAKRLIEDLMIAANGVSARFLEDHNFPSLRRVLREPKRWDRIVALAAALGTGLPAEPDARALEAYRDRGKLRYVKLVDGGLLEGALMGDGVPADKVYPIDMDRAFAKVAEIKPNVSRWWVAGADAPQSLIDGEVDIAAAYNGRIFGAQKEGAPLSLSWDQSLLQYDYWVVMKGSPNKENAEKFLAYISRPQPQAAFAEAISYGPVNNEAFNLVPKELLTILPGAPELAKKQLFQDYEGWNATGPDGRTNWDVALERCVALLSQ